MAYTQSYEASQPESMFPAADPIHQLPSSNPMDHSQNYPATESAASASGFEMYDDRQERQDTGMTASEEAGDAASRPRLTQEQLAQLERQFALYHKPNTEYKKSLAENMGVDYAKVNNWFQNRRAKAKHENQAQHRSDSSLDETHHVLPEDLSSLHYRRTSGPQNSLYYSSPEQAPVPSDDFASCLDFGSLNDPHSTYNIHSTPLLTDMGAVHPYDDGRGRPIQSSFANTVPTHPITSWPASNLYGDKEMPTHSVVELGSFGMSSESPPVQSYGLELTHGNGPQHGQTLYHNALDGQLVGNPSSQSFVTSPSEEDGHTRLITPPQETSPLPGLNQPTFQHDRRTSNDSDLAGNLDTIHLQQSQAGLGLYGNPNTSSAPDLIPTTGLLTPVITPDTTDHKFPFATDQDLATRRNRRPPKLQPDSGRSFSYAGPGTSPHLRISPPASERTSPVRRIRSTGNNLNVMTGRIKKQGTSSAQLSPRNFEACFQVAGMSDVQPNGGLHAHSHQVSGPTLESLPLSSPRILDQQHQVTWIDSPSHLAVAPASWDQGNHSNAPFHGPTQAPSWDPRQPAHTDVYATPPIQQAPHPHQYGYHFPPQSAPSHVTTFDAASSITPTLWQAPLIAPEPYRDDTQLSMSLRPYPPHNHTHSGPLQFFQPLSNHLPGYHSGMGSLQPLQHFFNRTPTPVLKPLDIKVDLGPSPPKELAQTSQERKEYTFQNSFSHDPDFAASTKK